MIIIGYPGIGKSTLARKKSNCIDLESSNFAVNGEKVKNWDDVYVNVAKDLSGQGYTVFVSSHGLVTSKLLNCEDVEVVTIFPSLDLKDEWVEKLRERCDQTKLEKDVRAYIRARTFYEDDVNHLKNLHIENPKIRTYEIQSMDYSLVKIVVEESKFKV